MEEEEDDEEEQTSYTEINLDDEKFNVEEAFYLETDLNHYTEHLHSHVYHRPENKFSNNFHNWPWQSIHESFENLTVVDYLRNAQDTKCKDKIEEVKDEKPCKSKSEEKVKTCKKTEDKSKCDKQKEKTEEKPKCNKEEEKPKCDKEKEKPKCKVKMEKKEDLGMCVDDTIKSNSTAKSSPSTTSSVKEKSVMDTAKEMVITKIGEVKVVADNLYQSLSEKAKNYFEIYKEKFVEVSAEAKCKLSNKFDECKEIAKDKFEDYKVIARDKLEDCKEKGIESLEIYKCKAKRSFEDLSEKARQSAEECKMKAKNWICNGNCNDTTKPGVSGCGKAAKVVDSCSSPAQAPPVDKKKCKCIYDKEKRECR